MLIVLAAAQLIRPLPEPVPTAMLPPVVRVGGTAPRLPWPPVGAAAVAVGSFGLLLLNGDMSPRPMASTAKVVTALVVLDSHPLRPGEPGPPLTISESDVAEYTEAAAQGQSVLPVTAGEQLSEYQLLQALLVPSANNAADLLARWDAGSLLAFVAKLNEKAAALGMASTHFADASGLSPQTVTTPADLVLAGRAALANPVLAQIVAQPQAELPVAGTVYNVNSALGRGGIVGVKTGSTGEAGACFLFAARQEVAGGPVTIYGAVMGLDTLADTFAAAAELVAATRAALGPVEVLPAGQLAAVYEVPWGGELRVVATEPVGLLGWPGMPVRASTRLEPLVAPLPAGSRVGSLTLQAGDETRTVDLVTADPLPAPDLRWRLTRP
jgi:D-alanyl-D-alanine carboxypeptidase (penicillin-binding protein 5/6)